MQRHHSVPRCLVSRRSLRRLSDNALYDLRHAVLPVLGELIAGILLIGGAAILLPLLLLSFA